MKKKVLITGASGFVGSHLVEEASNRGFEVHAVVRKTSKVDDIEPFVDKFIFTDMGNMEELNVLCETEQYNFVIHAAAMTKAKNESEMLMVNVGYTENLLSATLATSRNLQRIVYVSSLAAIGPISFDSTSLISEQSPYNPVTVYGRSKKVSELMIRSKFSESPITVIRPTAVYGPREKDLFILFDTLSKGIDPYIGRKPQKLSFVYVKDLVDSILNACVPTVKGLEFYNITDGKVYSRYAMADIFKQIFKSKALRIHIPYVLISFAAKLSQLMYSRSSKTPVLYPERLGELTAENWGCDISKAQDELGYKPNFDLALGLKQTLQWYKTNNWL